MKLLNYPRKPVITDPRFWLGKKQRERRRAGGAPDFHIGNLFTSFYYYTRTPSNYSNAMTVPEGGLKATHVYVGCRAESSMVLEITIREAVTNNLLYSSCGQGIPIPQGGDGYRGGELVTPVDLDAGEIDVCYFFGDVTHRIYDQDGEHAHRCKYSPGASACGTLPPSGCNDTIAIVLSNYDMIEAGVPLFY